MVSNRAGEHPRPVSTGKGTGPCCSTTGPAQDIFARGRRTLRRQLVLVAGTAGSIGRATAQAFVAGRVRTAAATEREVNARLPDSLLPDCEQGRRPSVTNPQAHRTN
jgi:hypothetical protein